MKSRRELLLNHYGRLLKRATSFAGLAALVLTLVVPLQANAATASFTARKTVLSNSAGAGTANYDIFVTTATATTTIKSFRLQVCTSPLQSVSCTAPSGFVWGSTIATQKKGASTFTNAYAGSPSGSDFLITNATGNSTTTSDVIEIQINGNTNPTAVNSEFYVRITSCSDTSCNVSSPYTNNVDFGGMAVSTTQVMSVTANVQESLVFAVGTSGATCAGVTGTTVTLSPNPMTTSAASTGTGVLCASTNATSGYTVTYTGTSFTSAAGTITAFPSSGTSNASSPNSEQFGFNLKANTTPSVGTAASGGSGSCTVNSVYCTVNSFAYDTSGGISIASAAGPTAETIFTVAYVANVAPTTKPGAYTATQTFIATGTF